MLKIRRYRPEDNKVVRELNDAGVAQMDLPVDIKTVPHIDSDFDDIEGVYLNGHGEFILGMEDGEIVAMGAFKRRTTECAEFKRLRIRPDRQRKGYGEAIMCRLMELAAEKGYTEGFLDTLNTNTRAQRLFEKLGWVKSGQDKMGPFEVFLYTRKLTPGWQVKWT
jgi:ribosomal protein S18 acetylase RimI-like enzyme